MDRQEVNKLLPEILCGNLSLPCCRRRKNKSCKCRECAYAISTVGKELLDKKFLLAYSRGGNK